MDRSRRAARQRCLLEPEAGLVLPIALIMLVVLSIIGIGAIMTSTSTTGMFGGLRRADEALYNAEAGVEAARRVIAQEVPNFDSVYADSGRLHLPGEREDGTVPYGSGSYAVVVLNDEDDPGYPPNPGDPNIEKNGRYIIHSTGRTGDAVKTLEVVVESFSRFFYFTEWEEAPLVATGSPWEDRFVFFRTGDNMDGPVHSNHALHLAGNPTFSALASSNEPPFGLYGSENNATIFLGGMNWGRLVTLPVGPDGVFGTNDDLTEVRNGASSKGRIIDTYDLGTGQYWEHRVHFRGDEGMAADIYRKNPATNEWQLVETLTVDANFNGVVYFHGGGPIHVGGRIVISGTDVGKLSTTSGVDSTVRGRWTICSNLDDSDLTRRPDITQAGEIRIIGDIRYVGSYGGGNPFPTNPEGLLGLVSANNVVIKEDDGEDTTQAIRNNGITIHASIMATSNENATFSVETALLDAVPGSAGRQINILGGIIQFRRGVVGVFTGSGLAQGFQKNYRYDTRLYYMSPPAFPLALNLKTKSWKE